MAYLVVTGDCSRRTIRICPVYLCILDVGRSEAYELDERRIYLAVTCTTLLLHRHHLDEIYLVLVVYAHLRIDVAGVSTELALPRRVVDPDDVVTWQQVCYARQTVMHCAILYCRTDPVAVGILPDWLIPLGLIVVCHLGSVCEDARVISLIEPLERRCPYHVGVADLHEALRAALADWRCRRQVCLELRELYLRECCRTRVLGVGSACTHERVVVVDLQRVLAIRELAYLNGRLFVCRASIDCRYCTLLVRSVILVLIQIPLVVRLVACVKYAALDLSLYLACSLCTQVVLCLCDYLYVAQVLDVHGLLPLDVVGIDDGYPVIALREVSNREVDVALLLVTVILERTCQLVVRCKLGDTCRAVCYVIVVELDPIRRLADYDEGDGSLLCSMTCVVDDCCVNLKSVARDYDVTAREVTLLAIRHLHLIRRRSIVRYLNARDSRYVVKSILLYECFRVIHLPPLPLVAEAYTLLRSGYLYLAMSLAVVRLDVAYLNKEIGRLLELNLLRRR